MQLLIQPTPRVFQAFGGFTSGIGIRYADSLITTTQHQSYAKNLIIGERFLPQVFLRAADSRAFEIQDLLPSDGRFKIILFIGDMSDSTQVGIINDLASELERVLGKFTLGHIFTVFDILAISSDTKTSIQLGYEKLPILLRSHWSRYISFSYITSGYPSTLIHMLPGFLLTTKISEVSVEVTDTRITESTVRPAQ